MNTSQGIPLNASAIGLPRDKRDTLFVLAVMAVVLAPHVENLPPWASAMAFALLGWRAAIAWRGTALPKRGVTWVLLAVAIASTWATYRTLLGAEAGVTFVLLLLVLKTLEMRAQRDAMVLFFLGFFTLMTLFFQSQSLSTAVAMLLGLWGLLAALVNAHLPHGKPPLTVPLYTAGQLMLWGAPCMVLLFLWFPRIPPLWGLPADQSRAKTGLSNQMEVGHIARLAQDPSVALRLRFLPAHGPAPDATQLYFRGPVLSHFDGAQWSALPDTARAGPSAADDAIEPRGRGIAYEATLQPHRQRWLLTPDATLQAPQLEGQRTSAAGPLQWLSQRPITDVLRYTAVMYPDYHWGRALTPAASSQNTQLPAQGNARTRAWGEQLRQQYPEQPAAVLAAVLQQLRQGGYRYTLEPAPVPADTADDFWFDQRAGFCEHMASALVVLLRAAGVPARVVTGYQGGERNAIDGLWTVRQSDAHAWAEVWLGAEGWTRVDPTAAVAPGRLGEQQRLQPPPTLLGHAIDRIVGIEHWQQLRARWEALNYRWNDWVLGYSAHQQTSVLQWLRALWERQRTALIAVAAALALAVGGAWHWRRQRRQPDPWIQLLEQARARLRAEGIPTGPHMGTQALAHAAIAQWGVSAAALQGWLERMERYRYAGAASGTLSLRTLRREFHALRWPRSRI